MPIPYLKEQSGKYLLMIEDKPMFLIAGEVHNSNASSVEYMEQVWEKAIDLGMNCLLLPVSWEMIEPEEGKFDFSIVEALIMQARRKGKKIGLLWFGTWKNAECTYAPPWVKTDLQRFRRAQIVKGENKSFLPGEINRSYTSLSYLCQATREADAKAFKKLMTYICEIDSQENTVVTVQVENETGILGADREYSDAADCLFKSQVPEEFIKYMKCHMGNMAEDVYLEVLNGDDGGDWSQVFGKVAAEVFSAYHISQYVNEVASAGKEVYPLPMTVNCWLNKKGDRPGDYPSGGPVARMYEVWKYGAPMIDIYCPDIYVPSFCAVCDEYMKLGNPLYIPECATHSYAGARMVYAVGQCHALCYAPFGFEEMGEPFNAVQGFLFGMDVKDPALKIPQSIEEYQEYSTALTEMMPILTAAYGTRDLQAMSSENKEVHSLDFGEFRITADFASSMLKANTGVCLGLMTGENEIFILANHCRLQFESTNIQKPHVDILLAEQGEFKQGVWIPGRRFNGDEIIFMLYDNVTLLHIKLFSYGNEVE